MEKARALVTKALGNIVKLHHKAAVLIRLHINSNPLKQIGSLFLSHRTLIFSSIFSLVFIVFISAAIYQGYFVTVKPSSPQANSNNTITSQSGVSSTPSLDPTPTDATVLGASTDPSSDNNGGNYTIPTYAPIPTSIPTAIPTPIPTDTPEPTAAPSNSSSSSNDNSGNPNCTTGSGVPNSWYSDVYPNPPITTNNGSVTLSVTIRDCNINTAPVSDNLSISLGSGDSGTQINGNNLPYTVTTQNGQASFNVTSQNSGIVVLIVQDTSHSFTVTDTNNNNPSINFSISAAASPTPTPSQVPINTTTPTPTTIPMPTSNITPTPASSSASTTGTP